MIFQFFEAQQYKQQQPLSETRLYFGLVIL